ncbi:MAG: DUF1841 family protein [Gammaproteobacteria bacterium]|nr:DUF1841 family protein [Gammaproteobacteria bacterium]MCH9716807.1 DUF1841 family protein [Gammaproteobacteria bacterium]MCH9763151.1 DUF1841 family protein [Gammaproteobacteria bacterium]
MFQAENVQDTRPFFFETWAKYKQSQPLTPLEDQLIDVILAHPEYHVVLDNPKRTADKTYFAELGMSNPFLHMGLHLAVRDQVKTNRPPGIQSAYNTLSSQLKAPLEAEHQLMQCLEDCLWRAQQHNTMPDESAYLQACLAKTTASN